MSTPLYGLLAQARAARARLEAEQATLAALNGGAKDLLADRLGKRISGYQADGDPEGLQAFLARFSLEVEKVSGV
jgi:hypothetical protein